MNRQSAVVGVAYLLGVAMMIMLAFNGRVQHEMVLTVEQESNRQEEIESAPVFIGIDSHAHNSPINITNDVASSFDNGVQSFAGAFDTSFSPVLTLSGDGIANCSLKVQPNLSYEVGGQTNGFTLTASNENSLPLASSSNNIVLVSDIAGPEAWKTQQSNHFLFSSLPIVASDVVVCELPCIQDISGANTSFFVNGNISQDVIQLSRQSVFSTMTPRFDVMLSSPLFLEGIKRRHDGTNIYSPWFSSVNSFGRAGCPQTVDFREAASFFVTGATQQNSGIDTDSDVSSQDVDE